MCRMAFIATLCLFAPVAPLAAQPAPSSTHHDLENSSDFLAIVVLHDLEFMLLTWKTPTPYPGEMAAWMDTTRSRLNHLRLIAADTGLNGNVANAVDTVEDLLDDYEDLHNRLRMAEWVRHMSAIEGEETALTKGSQLFGATLEGAALGWEVTAEASHGNPKAVVIGSAVAGLLTVFGESLGDLGEKLEMASKYARLDAAKAEFVQAEINNTIGRFRRGLEEVRRFATAAAGEYSPSFEIYDEAASYRPAFPDSHFPHVIKAVELAPLDRVEAAEEYAVAASKLPSGSRYFSEFYRGPFLLFAGHLMEVESRRGPPEAQTSAAQRAVDYFRQAEDEMDIGVFPYSYQISYARALAAAGLPSQAIKIARIIEREIPPDGIYRAVRTYDLGGLMASVGDLVKAFAMLEESYRSFPRRDPYALQDPQLAPLRSSEDGRERLRLLADHPLVGGAWEEEEGDSVYHFYPDGSLWQRRTRSEIHTGRWSARDGKTLRLFDRDHGLEDVEVRYEANMSSLVIFYEGYEYRYTRQDGDLLADYSNTSLSGRTLSNHGRWTSTNGETSVTGRYSTSRSLMEQRRKFLYSWEDPIAGPLFELLEEKGPVND